MSAGAPDPTGELTALPRSPIWFQEGRFAAGGEWRGWEGRTRGPREGLGGRVEEGEEGRGGMGKGGDCQHYYHHHHHHYHYY